MGICQSTPHHVETQLSLPQPNQLTIQRVKPSKYQISEQVAMPIDQIPELLQPVKITLQKLGAFDFEKCEKYSTGKDMRPYKFPNGTVYVGEWYNGKPHGRGKYYLPDHAYFQGISVDGDIQGYGRIIHANGDYYEGQLRNGQANGKGIYRQGQIMFQGYFKDNLQHGAGHQHNSKYEFKGQFSQGQKLKGKLTLNDKKYQYQGEFKYNKFHGNGSLIVDNEKYQGYFAKGFKSGKGKITYEDGSYYEGDFKGNQKHGVGRLYAKNKKLIRQQQWENGILLLK